jgi:hypothetical protein
MSPVTENPRGNPAYLLRPINYNIPYLPIPTRIQKSKTLAKKRKLKKISRDVKKKHCRPPENSVYKLRKTNIPFYEQIVPHKGVFILTLKPENISNMFRTRCVANESNDPT